jgi:hypothetical protein
MPNFSSAKSKKGYEKKNFLAIFHINDYLPHLAKNKMITISASFEKKICYEYEKVVFFVKTLLLHNF